MAEKKKNVQKIYPPPTDFAFHIKARHIWKEQTTYGNNDMAMCTSTLTLDVSGDTMLI